MTVELPPGTILLDKYRVDRVLGKGGMGVVLAATHLQLNERVAMKFLLPEVLGNHEIVQRFMREAQAAVRLKGEHVARVIDVGTLPWGAPYMVMEFLQGMDLAQLIQERGVLPAHEAADYLLQACEALAEAHSLGIIHRDIKPANFFITKRPDGSPLLKVLDFGISKAPVTMDGGLTSTQAVMGTPSYMSPEQMRSVRDVDARTDIWALGVVLYEALGGRRPFEADTFSALCLKAAMDPTPPLNVRVPPGMEPIVYRCLEKEPAHRYASMAELALALAPYAGNQRQASIVVERTSAILGVAAPRSTGEAPQQVGGGEPASRQHYAAAASPTTLGASAGSLVTAAERRSSRRGVWIGSALVAVTSLVAVVVLMTRAGKGTNGSGDPGDQVQPTTGGPQPPPAGPGSATVPPPEPELAKPVESVEPKKVEPPPAADPATTDGAATQTPQPAPVKSGKTSRDRSKSRSGDKKVGDKAVDKPVEPVVKPVEKPPEEKKPPPPPVNPLDSRT